MFHNCESAGVIFKTETTATFQMSCNTQLYFIGVIMSNMNDLRIRTRLSGKGGGGNWGKPRYPHPTLETNKQT